MKYKTLNNLSERECRIMVLDAMKERWDNLDDDIKVDYESFGEYVSENLRYRINGSEMSEFEYHIKVANVIREKWDELDEKDKSGYGGFARYAEVFKFDEVTAADDRCEIINVEELKHTYIYGVYADSLQESEHYCIQDLKFGEADWFDTYDDAVQYAKDAIADGIDPTEIAIMKYDRYWEDSEWDEELRFDEDGEECFY